MAWIKTPSFSSIQKPGRFLLVTAHPDDEVMFFTPLLTNLKNNGNHVSILCLSDGNFEGLGNLRSNELIKCAAMFNIAAKDVHIINNEHLQDGMKNDWPLSTVAEVVQQYIQSSEPSYVSLFKFG